MWETSEPLVRNSGATPSLVPRHVRRVGGMNV